MGEGNRHDHRRVFNEPGHGHELTFNCFHRYRFLSSERTCTWLAEAIEAARQAHDFSLWAYVFMPEHVHLVVMPRRPDYDISSILKAIKTPVASRAIAHIEEHAPSWLPRITRSRGRKTERLFWMSGGGFDRNIIEPSTLRFMMDYIHLNPIRKSLAEKPADWRWSSAGWYEGLEPNSLRPDPVPPEWAT
jgi:putative transposase